MNTLRIFPRALVPLPLLFCLLLPLVSHAVIFTVTDTNDDGSIHSLRAAIRMANAIGGKNTIVLGKLPKNFTNPPPHLTFHLTQAGADEDAARTGDLDITRGHLEINGLPLGDTTIDATGLGDRVFQVDAKASLTLENVTIQGGTAPSGATTFADGEYGGAIYNSGTLTLLNCIITNNSSGPGHGVEGNGGGTGGGDGGGIYNAGILSALNSDFIGNAAGFGVDGAFGGNGGGLRNDGACFLTNCLVEDNQTGAGGGPDGNAGGFGGSGGSGSGIFNNGTLVLSHCFISGNVCASGSSGGYQSGGFNVPVGGPGGNGGSGAGIYNEGEVQLDFSTVYGNVAGDGGDGGVAANAGIGGDGAGIFNAGRFTLNTCTISSNLCGLGGNGGRSTLHIDGASGGSGGSGGGICNVGSLNVTSCTIVQNQTGAGGNGGNTIGGAGGAGGGILNDEISTNVIIRNTLLALNLVSVGGTNGPTGLGFDVAGDFTSDGFNLIGQADDSAGFTNGIAADQTGTDAAPLDPLISPALLLYAFNGGRPAPFLCYPLFGGSPAVDQGNSFGITADIGGSSRPYDFPSVPNAIGGDGTDIGSYEAHVLVPFPIIIPPTPLQPQPTNSPTPLPN